MTAAVYRCTGCCRRLCRRLPDWLPACWLPWIPRLPQLPPGSISRRRIRISAAALRGSPASPLRGSPASPARRIRSTADAANLPPLRRSAARWSLRIPAASVRRPAAVSDVLVEDRTGEAHASRSACPQRHFFRDPLLSPLGGGRRNRRRKMAVCNFWFVSLRSFRKNTFLSHVVVAFHPLQNTAIRLSDTKPHRGHQLCFGIGRFFSAVLPSLKCRELCCTPAPPTGRRLEGAP